MARKTNIYTQLHNANIGEYVTDSIDIFDSYSNQSLYDFNKSVRAMIANSAVIGGSSNLKLKITPSSFFVKSSQGCTLTCEVTFNGEDYTDVVIKWQIERISVNKEDDAEWFEEKNNGKEPLTNIIELSARDLNGDAAMFIVTAIITTDMKCDNSVSLMGNTAISNFTFDLNNQLDFVATDNMMVVQWDQTIKTRASLSYGSIHIEPDEISFEYNGLPNGCAAYNSKLQFDITVTLPAGVKVNYNNALIVNVSGTYNGETYNKQVIFTIKADTDGVIYNVAPSRDKIRLSSTGVYTPTTLTCRIKKQNIKGITYPEETPKGLKLTMAIDEGPEKEILPGTVISLFGDNMTTITSGVIFTLYENDQFLDTEWVPVISDGITGESTIKLDLDNEMDAIPVDSNYITLENTIVSTNATMYYGQTEMTFVRNIATKLDVTTPDAEDEEYLKNIVTKITYKKSNKLLYITVSCALGVLIPKHLNITLSAMGTYGTPGEPEYKAKKQSATFSVIPVVVSDETPLYYLIPSANSIKVNKSNARQPINIGVTCKKRTGTTGYITTDYGYVTYQIDDEAPEMYTKPIDTEEIGEQILFEYYDDEGELLDRESIPVIFDGKDGASGRSIKDMHEYYLATATKDDIPSYDEEWLLDEFPDENLFNEEYPYLWNYEETIYINYGTDASVWRSTPSLITRYVKGIKSIDEYYLAVPESTGIDASYVKAQDIFLTKNGLYEWLITVIPEMSDISAYLWNFERINYDTGTFTITDPGIIGIHGESNFFIDIDNLQDFISVGRIGDIEGMVLPSHVMREDLVTYPNIGPDGKELSLNSKDIVFDTCPNNKGIVFIKSNFTVYYGNTKAQVKGIGFEYSDPLNFKAMAYNIPNTIYPIIIDHENGDEESTPDIIGSYKNPYIINDKDEEETDPNNILNIKDSRGNGHAKPEYVDRGDVYVTGIIVGYLIGDYEVVNIANETQLENLRNGKDADGNTISPEDIKGIVIYNDTYDNIDPHTSKYLRILYVNDPTKSYGTDPAIYNNDSEENYGLNVIANTNYINKGITIMGIMVGNQTMVATDYAEIYLDDDIKRFSTIYGAYDLSSIDFYVLVRPKVVIDKVNWVRIIVDIEAFGKVHRSYAILSLYAASPGQDAKLYQLLPSHKQIQHKKNGTFVPSVEANVTCHIVKRRGNDNLENIPFEKARNDVSLFYAFDSGDYTYIPFDAAEHSKIIAVRNAINGDKNVEGITYINDIPVDPDDDNIPLIDKYSLVLNVPEPREVELRERYNPTIKDYESIVSINDVSYGNYKVDMNDHNRRSRECAEFPMWKVRDMFSCYLNPDGTFKRDENGKIIATFSQISFKLLDANSGELIDLVQIPVLYDGEESFIADLDNEMDSVAMDELNYTVSSITGLPYQVLHTTFTIRVGKENYVLKNRELKNNDIFLINGGKKTVPYLQLLIDENHELPLIHFIEKDKAVSVDPNNIKYDFDVVTNYAEESKWPSKIYWDCTHIIDTNEYVINVYVPDGVGAEILDGIELWQHDNFVIEVRGTLDRVSSDPNSFETTMVEIYRSSIFTIHGVACGEDRINYQIMPTYNNIKITDIGEYMPDTIDCVIKYRYGTGELKVYKDGFGKIYRDFLLGPTDRTTHAFGRDALVIGYTIDDENNLNTNGFEAAHFWVHSGYEDPYLGTGIQADDDNDTNFIPFEQMSEYPGEIPTDENELNDPDNAFNLWCEGLDYPHIPTYKIGEKITFYLYLKKAVIDSEGELSYNYILIDKESVPIVEAAHAINDNLVNGTYDGGNSVKEKWNTYGTATIPEKHDFRLYNSQDAFISPEIELQDGKEFVVSLECRFVKVEDGKLLTYSEDTPDLIEDISIAPPEYNTDIPAGYRDRNTKYSLSIDDLTGRNGTSNAPLGPAFNGYHLLSLEFFDDKQKTPQNVYYTFETQEEVDAYNIAHSGDYNFDISFARIGGPNPDKLHYPKNETGILAFKGSGNNSYTRNTIILSNYGYTDKLRFKEWTRVKFAPYQADDIRDKYTDKAYFKLRYDKPAVPTNEEISITGTDYVLLIRHIKLEYGDVATTWCLSEWDKRGLTVLHLYEFYYATDSMADDPAFWKLEVVLPTPPKEAPAEWPRDWDIVDHIPYTINNTTRYDWYNTVDGAYAAKEERVEGKANDGLDLPYLWNVEIIKDQHDKIASISEPALITTSGVKPKKVREFYLATYLGSGVTTEMDGWVEDTDGSRDYTFGLNDYYNYLWNYERIEYTQDIVTETAPVIVSVFNSNLRIDLSNEVDSIPVNRDTLQLSAQKDLSIETTLTFFHGTLALNIWKIYATFDIFTEAFNAKLTNSNDDGYTDLTDLMSIHGLNIDVYYLKDLLEIYTNVSENSTDLDKTNKLTLYKAIYGENGIINNPEEGKTWEEAFLEYVDTNVCRQFIIECMLMNFLNVKIIAKSIIKNSYSCLLDENEHTPVKINEIEYLTVADNGGDSDIFDNDTANITVTAYSEIKNAANTIPGPKKIFPLIIDLRIGIKIATYGAHLSYGTSLDNEVNPQFKSAALFTIMLFEGNGVYQLVPSCTEIKETSLGIQYATDHPINWFVRNTSIDNIYVNNTIEQEKLFIDTIDEDTLIENIDFITCKILYRKAIDDSSYYNNYNDVSSFLSMEISDDGGAFLKQNLWAAENSFYNGTEYNKVYVIDTSYYDDHNKVYVPYYRPMTAKEINDALHPRQGEPEDPDTWKYYNTGTGYFPRIPLYTEKARLKEYEAFLKKSNWYITNSITFVLKLNQWNDAKGKIEEVVLDRETIPVIRDGKDGLDGASFARNYLDGTSDGSEYKRRISIRNITDDYYRYNENGVVPYELPSLLHMSINTAILEGLDYLKIISGSEREFMRLSGLLKLSIYDQNTTPNNGPGYYISWGKPNIAVTVMLIITDGKGVLENGVYYASDILFNCYESGGSGYLYSDIMNSLETNYMNGSEEYKLFDTIKIETYLAQSSSDTILVNKNRDQKLTNVIYSRNGYNKFGVSLTGLLLNGTNRITKDIFIDLVNRDSNFEENNDRLGLRFEGNDSEPESILYVGEGVDITEYRTVSYILKYYATPTNLTHATIGGGATSFGLDDNDLKKTPNISLLIINPTLTTNNILDVSTLQLNDITELHTKYHFDDPTTKNGETGLPTYNILFDELVYIPEKFRKNSYVKLSSYMLPEIEIEYSRFKLELEYDAPKEPTIWCLSEYDKSRPNNYNILFGTETCSYLNVLYWQVIEGNKNSILVIDEEADVKSIRIAATSTAIKVKNLNVITPNEPTHYTFSFEAKYSGEQPVDNKLEVYLMYKYRPPFDSFDAVETAYMVNGEDYTYNYDDDTVTPPTLNRNLVFDEVTGTLVFAKETFELSTGYNRYVMFTTHKLQIDEYYLHDFPFLYELYIVFKHPGADDGIKKSYVYIKKPKLERGLIPTDYEINLDEYRGCSFELVPYFETVEVRTGLPDRDLTTFNINTQFETKIIETNEDTGEAEEKDLTDYNIVDLAESKDNENIMSWFTLFKEYTTVNNTNIIAYISDGTAPDNVATPVITYNINGLKEINITISTPYARIYYYIDYKIFYLTDANAGIVDFEEVTYQNGILWKNQLPKITEEATVYALGLRDAYNNSELASLIIENIHEINNIYGDGYTPYINCFSFLMGTYNSSNYINLYNNIIILGDIEQEKLRSTNILTPKNINTMIINVAGTIEKEVNVFLRIFDSNANHLANTEERIIIIYPSDTNCIQVVKYFEPIVILNNQYLGITADSPIKIGVKNYNNIYNGIFDKIKIGKTILNSILNIDLGYTYSTESD